MEEEERKTEMGGGEGSTVLPSHGGLHKKKIREKRIEERERSVFLSQQVVKQKSILMCLVGAQNTRLEANVIAPMLSHQRVGEEMRGTAKCLSSIVYLVKV
jgi:hypothetical protein